MRCRFTLVEVLVTATIIGVLMAILLPTINKAREKARVVQAKADIKALEIAIKQYESTYGFLPAEVRNRDSSSSNPDVRWEDFADDPSSSGADNDWQDVNNDDKKDHTRVIEDLACLGEDPDSPYAARRNQRDIRMLEKISQFTNSGHTHLSMIDPWQRRYRMVWDTYDSGSGNHDRPYDGRIARKLINGFHHPYTSSSDDQQPTYYVYASYVVWSTGPDMDESRSDPTNSGDSAPQARQNRDNVYSIQTDWKAADGHVPK
jgi:type II secretory pathway pseudopilin PulG